MKKILNYAVSIALGLCLLSSVGVYAAISSNQLYNEVSSLCDDFISSALTSIRTGDLDCLSLNFSNSKRTHKVTITGISCDDYVADNVEGFGN